MNVRDEAGPHVTLVAHGATLDLLAERPHVSSRPGTLVLLLFASTLGVMAGAIISPVIALIRDDLGVGDTAAGLIITTHGLVIAVVSPAAGWLIDRWGLRRPLIGGFILYGIAGGAGLFASSYATLIASRVLFGAGAAVLFTGTTAAILTLYEGPGRDRVMGLRTMATSLGGVAWPLVGGALGAISWHLPFGVYLLGIPLGLAAIALLPEVSRQPAQQTGNLVRLLRSRRILLAFYGLQLVASVLLYGIVVFLP